MKKKASKKKQPAKAVKMFGTGRNRRPDLRTKAGLAWKARRAAREDRKQMRAEIARLEAEEKARRARNREADKAAAKAAVTGSWVDLKDHPANVHVHDAGESHMLSEACSLSPEVVENAHNPGSPVLLDVPTDMDALKASGMYWELFPEGRVEEKAPTLGPDWGKLKPLLVTDAVGTTGGKATVAYWRVGV